MLNAIYFCYCGTISRNGKGLDVSIIAASGIGHGVSVSIDFN